MAILLVSLDTIAGGDHAGRRTADPYVVDASSTPLWASRWSAAVPVSRSWRPRDEISIRSRYDTTGDGLYFND